MWPAKSTIINDKQRLISGVSADDPYYGAITDNFESDFVEFCRRHVRDDYLCWDIGSNIGITSMIISDFCPNGKVIAVDGGEILTEIHNKNIKQNGIKNVKPLNYVVNEVDGEVGFIENSAYGSINLHAKKFRAISPATLAGQYGGAPDFVKIDCEGYDHIVLRAGLEIFKKKGTLVQFEFNSWNIILNKIAQPLEILEWTVVNFPFVFVRRPGQAELEPINGIGLVTMLYRNMTQQPYTFLDDIVVTSDGSRLNT